MTTATNQARFESFGILMVRMPQTSRVKCEEDLPIAAKHRPEMNLLEQFVGRVAQIRDGAVNGQRLAGHDHRGGDTVSVRNHVA